jgi:glycosyltransferase involved in cell wall biosynthesis
LGIRDASLGDAALNVAIAEGMADRLEAVGVAPERIAVIPNWADIEAIRPRPATDSGLRQVCLPQAEFVVGYSGNLGPVHDWQTVFEAMLRLRSQSNIRFLFIGGGLGMKALRQQVAAAGLGSACFLPYRPRAALGRALAAADLHLVTLKPALEGLLMPSKLYGVLAAGRPVLHVGDLCGESAELVTAAGAGIAVASGDGAGLAEAILTLAADRARLAAMGRRARRLCEARFAAADVLGCWERCLRSLAVQARAGGEGGFRSL